MKNNLHKISFALAISITVSASQLYAEEALPKMAEVKELEGGAVHVDDLVVPLSDFITPRAREVIMTNDAWALSGFTDPNAKDPGPVTKEALRESCAKQSKVVVERLNKQYPVNVQHLKIAGIDADVVTPKEGLPANNANRILINVHGGGWIGKCPDGLVESIPISATGGFKVVTIDYRLAPEHKHPAASEDLVAVYKSLLDEYKPENIGIYGCSAGGYLTAQGTAWIIDKGLPIPGAIGVFCGGFTWGIQGDSFATEQFAGTNTTDKIRHLLTYFDGADPDDPMVSPGLNPDLLAKYPPTLFITATRDGAMSGSLFAHNELTKVGVESHLHVWDGLWHSFQFDDLPEARDANKIIVRFFDRYLGSGKL